MIKFSYKAYDSSGAEKKGSISAVSKESAIFKLKEDGLIPVQLKKENKDDLSVKFSKGFSFRSVTYEIEEFTSRLSLLLKNKIKIDKALGLSIKGITHEKLKAPVTEITNEVRKGVKLSESMSKYPDLFDNLYITMVKVGEESGDLSKAFLSIAESLAFRRDILSRTRQAMIYPMIILSICIGSVFFIFNFIVPRFSVIFQQEKDLPGYTKLLLGLSDFFLNYQVFFIPALIISGFLLWYFRNIEVVKKAKSFIAVKFPFIKGLTFTYENLRYSSAISMLLSNGVVLSDALEYSTDSVSNSYIKDLVTPVKNKVRQGESLSSSLENIDFFPEIYDGLIEAGEQTGSLGEVFFEMEARIKKDYEKKITGLLTALEPIMIVIMGVIVGSVVVGLLLSMVSVNDIVI